MPLMRRNSLAVGLACAALALTWQALTVRYNYGGDWTALFCTGGKLSVPPQLAQERIYTFANSMGYDGQFYHYVAHDPLLRRGFSQYVDAPRMRYRRILAPALACLLAAGQDRFVDTAFFGVILLWVFLGAYWLSRYASEDGHHPAWGLCFLLVPATIVSLDRLTIDVALAALTVGFALYVRHGPPWKLFLVLACAPLARETGALLPAAYCLYLLWRRLPGRAALFSTAIVPALAWFAYVQPRTQGDMVDFFLRVPDSLQLLVTPQYDLPRFLALAVTALDYLLIAGVLLAVVLTIRFVVKGTPGPMETAGLMFGLMTAWMVFFLRQDDPYTYPRLAAPMLVLVALQGLACHSRIGLLPVALVTARVAAQFGNQVLGILRGPFSH